ncbi:MAG: nickel-dependent lactate racemase [Bacillota bacterium]
MKTVSIPWGCWYGNREERLFFPDSWDVQVARIADARSLDVHEIEERLDSPIGSPPLSEIARGKKTAGILVDDISRPTPAYQVLPLIVRRLEQAGLRRDSIIIVLALGAHRALTRADMVKKLGEEIVSTVEVVNHHPYENLVSLGRSKMGTPVDINRRFMETDVKISVGCILPHPTAGYGGGAKNVVPGVCGIETLRANHSTIYFDSDGKKLFHRAVGNPDNPLRHDMEDIARMVGLAFIVNVVVNSRLGIAGLFAGDLVEAHRAGVRLAEKVYRTKLVEAADIVVLNAYPKDTEFVQLGNVFNVIGTSNPGALVKGCGRTIVICTAATEGAGFHSLASPGMKLYTAYDNTMPPHGLQGTEVLLYSRTISEREAQPFFERKAFPLFRDWANLLVRLKSKHTAPAKVAVYPMAPIQMGC